jgi:hypothetical protein
MLTFLMTDAYIDSLSRAYLSLGLDLAPIDHSNSILANWQPAFGHLESPWALSGLTGATWGLAWLFLVQFGTFGIDFLHFLLIWWKSIVTTLTTGDDYIDNITWCHPGVTMTNWYHSRSVGHKHNPDYFPRW